MSIQENEIETVEERWFSHSGDLGDIIYSLPTIRKAGGGPLYLCHIPRRSVFGMSRERAESIVPLLRLQPYIEESSFLDEARDCQLNKFRKYLGHFRTLADAHLAAYGWGPEERAMAWLHVDEIWPIAPVVIHRSERRHNRHFPWQRVVDRYKKHSVFVGALREWELFCRGFGYVPYYRTSNCLELARVIGGARLFIGNQSLPEAIAEGMKRDKILEVSPKETQRCMFKRVGASFVLDEHYLELPDIG